VFGFLGREEHEVMIQGRQEGEEATTFASICKSKIRGELYAMH